jgi:hypothetical protein
MYRTFARSELKQDVSASEVMTLERSRFFNPSLQDTQMTFAVQPWRHLLRQSECLFRRSIVTLPVTPQDSRP